MHGENKLTAISEGTKEDLCINKEIRLRWELEESGLRKLTLRLI
jgi:hypothetical protein